MRIQHNIMAMNAYRNYSNNTSALSKNLEKLSSGYKINRAGDDAAGLAISEKMRAQITGLDVAQKNAKDGISLVQTAEGALTEVHDMLNRMVELANQSANGTYDATDRTQLQKEIDELTSEIDRIADSSNFNGIKLLDGSLAGSGSVGSSGNVAVDFSGKSSWITQGTKVAQVNTATFGAIAANSISAGDTVSFELKLSDGSSYKLNATMVANGNAGKLVLDDGTVISTTASSVAISAQEMATFAQAALNRDANFSSKFTAAVSGTNGGITLTANSGSFDTPSIISMNISGGKASVSAQAAITTPGKGNYNILNVGSMTVYDASSDTKNKENSIVTINGQQFAFVKDAASAKELGSNVNVIITNDTTAPDNADVKSLVNLVNQKTGLNIKAPTTGASLDMISYGNGGASSGGLTLQIGDTSDSFNQLNVSIGNTHAASLGIDSINISTQGGAQAAVEVIKNAINTVSDIRGTLGATQNRLDHTINNLSVMQENIQDAESTIRDTDVADEMMEYTKNNILIQSAQAMLAQANQVPQGVLQLLQ